MDFKELMWCEIVLLVFHLAQEYCERARNYVMNHFGIPSLNAVLLLSYSHEKTR